MRWAGSTLTLVNPNPNQSQGKWASLGVRSQNWSKVFAEESFFKSTILNKAICILKGWPFFCRMVKKLICILGKRRSSIFQPRQKDGLTDGLKSRQISLLVIVFPDHDERSSNVIQIASHMTPNEKPFLIGS